jgi:hypothetical protein
MERELAQARQELAEAVQRAQRAEAEIRQATERSAAAQRRFAEPRQARERAEQERDQADQDRAVAQRRARSATRVRDEAERRVKRLTTRQRGAAADRRR